MTEFNNLNKRNLKSKIPQSLFIAGIISLLYTGFTILSFMLSLEYGKPSEEEIMKSKLELAIQLVEAQKSNIDFLVRLIKKLQLMLDAMYANFFMYYFVAFLVAAVGVAGIILMFRRKELGFHFYIIYSLLYVAQSYLFVSPTNVPLILVLTNLFVSGIFIYIYSRSLNWFRQTND
jgi:hypothetical protein